MMHFSLPLQTGTPRFLSSFSFNPFKLQMEAPCFLAPHRSPAHLIMTSLSSSSDSHTAGHAKTPQHLDFNFTNSLFYYQFWLLASSRATGGAKPLSMEFHQILSSWACLQKQFRRNQVTSWNNQTILLPFLLTCVHWVRLIFARRWKSNWRVRKIRDLLQHMEAVRTHQPLQFPQHDDFRSVKLLNFGIHHLPPCSHAHPSMVHLHARLPSYF